MTFTPARNRKIFVVRQGQVSPRTGVANQLLIDCATSLYAAKTLGAAFAKHYGLVEDAPFGTDWKEDSYGAFFKEVKDRQHNTVRLTITPCEIWTERNAHEYEGV